MSAATAHSLPKAELRTTNTTSGFIDCFPPALYSVQGALVSTAEEQRGLFVASDLEGRVSATPSCLSPAAKEKNH